MGLKTSASLLWAVGGVLCTPSWYYGTSTYDDILGSTALVLALAAATGRRDRPLVGSIAAGLALGLAFNCKQPLGIFVLPVMAALYDPEEPWQSQRGRLAAVAAGLAVGVAAYLAYEWYKFPPGSTASHAELLKKYPPIWSGDPVTALAVLAISPGAGALFYNPSLLICIWGIRGWYRTRWLFCTSLLASIAVYVLFICSLSFFKGIRRGACAYLTPVFAALWILAPAGSGGMRRWAVVSLLAAGLLVQLAAISISAGRLYAVRRLPAEFCLYIPKLYFHPAVSHLVNRPGEIMVVYRIAGEWSVFDPPPQPPIRSSNSSQLGSQGNLSRSRHQAAQFLSPLVVQIPPPRPPSTACRPREDRGPPCRGRHRGLDPDDPWGTRTSGPRIRRLERGLGRRRIPASSRTFGRPACPPALRLRSRHGRPAIMIDTLGEAVVIAFLEGFAA